MLSSNRFLKVSLVAVAGKPDILRTNYRAELPPVEPREVVGASTGEVISLPAAVYYYCFISILNNYYI